MKTESPSNSTFSRSLLLLAFLLVKAGCNSSTSKVHDAVAVGAGGGTAALGGNLTTVGGNVATGGSTGSEQDRHQDGGLGLGGITASGGRITTGGSLSDGGLGQGGTATGGGFSTGGIALRKDGSVDTSDAMTSAGAGGISSRDGGIVDVGGAFSTDADRKGSDGGMDVGVGVGGSGACGREGSSCCLGNRCDNGGCCLDGYCLGNGQTCSPLPGICTNGSCGSCGGAGQAPCQINTGVVQGSEFCTAPGTTHSGDFCVLCGGSVGEACCSVLDAGYYKSICLASGLICNGTGFPTYCIACGKPGGPCCAGDLCDDGGCCYDGACSAAGAVCSASSDATTGGTCTAGHCANCGGQGQACCGSKNPSCGKDLVCQSGSCVSCGEPGQACCSNANGKDRCNSGSLCSTKNPQEAGVCGLCGGPGQPCCPGNACEGGCCLAGRCLAEGAACVYERTSYGTCSAGRCGCGGSNQPCCPSATEGNPANVCSTRALRCSDANPSQPSTCLTCGALGAPCCAYEMCQGSGLDCVYHWENAFESWSSCENCGEIGQRCCENRYAPYRCHGTDVICDTDSTTSATKCAVCGVAGGPCCPVDTCRDSATTCLRRRCLPCGRTGQPCCPGGQCTSGCCVSRMDSNIDNGPTCVDTGAACEPAAATGPTCGTDGSCQGATTTCGGIGQNCCPSAVYSSTTSYSYCSAQGSRCTYNYTTKGYTCGACGDLDQQGCVNGSTEQPCKPPYVLVYRPATMESTCGIDTKTITSTLTSAN